MLPVIFCFVPFLLLAHFAGASSAHFNRILREPSSCPADEKERWSYRGSNDPEYWGQIYNTCNGREQSPIDIDTSKVVSDPDIPKLEMTNYEKPVSKVMIKNNGHTIKLIPEDDIKRTINVEGSPYKLVQIHFHWGDQSTRGSEHLIDNSATAMEMHLVHLNSEDEISVIGVRFNETNGWERKCNELQKLVDVFPEVLYKDKTTHLDSDLNLNDLVPENPASSYHTRVCRENQMVTANKKSARS